MKQKYINILKYYVKPQSISIIKQNWNKFNRYYHNELNHLSPLLDYIDINLKHKLTKYEYISYILAAFFHDVIYNPSSNNNENESINFFISNYNYIGSGSNIIKNNVINLIECTKHRIIPSNPFLNYFWKADNNILYKNIDNLIKYEELIRNEYKYVNIEIYKKNRIKFLLSCTNNIKNPDLLKLIEYINNKY